MKIPSGRTLLAFFALLGRVAAGEWSAWETLDGEKISERVGAVEIRSRRDEVGDQMEKGYLFIYEIRNASNSHAAKVALAFPLLDPATQTWAEIDSNQPTVMLHVPPMGTVTANQYSPNSHVLNYSSTIFWPDGISPPKNLEDLAANAAKPTETEATQKTFEGVPLSDNAALQKALRKYQARDDDVRFRATIVFQIPPGETIWQGIVDGAAVDREGTWRQRLEDWFSFVQIPHVIDGRAWDYRLQIVSVTESAMTVRFEDVILDHLLSYLDTESDWGWKENNPVVKELVLLEPGKTSTTGMPEGKSAAATDPRGNPENGPADQDSGKVIPGSQPTAKSGGIEVKAVTHSGYWFDPEDKDAKGDDPVIYVRIAGQAKRVRLAAAKEAYGVPASAARDTMSHYNERQGKVIVDRGTHRP